MLKNPGFPGFFIKVLLFGQTSFGTEECFVLVLNAGYTRSTARFDADLIFAPYSGVCE